MERDPSRCTLYQKNKRILSLPGSIPGPHVTSPQFIIALLFLLFLSVLLLCLLVLDTSGPGHMTGPSENDSGADAPVTTISPDSCCQGESSGQLLPYFLPHVPQLFLSSLETSRTSRLKEPEKSACPNPHLQLPHSNLSTLQPR